MTRFRDALAAPGVRAIAEIKRRSPSAGDLRPDADPAGLGRAFERAGAAAISVLVNGRFGGSVDDLRAARSATTLPLLAKGFFHAEDDLLALREAGADAVLLLLRDLDDRMTVRLRERAASLGLETLVEAHDAAELDRAVALGAEVIGVNARDLSTFRVDRLAQLDLMARAPGDRVVVAESGILHRAHAAAAELAGADAVLVGSALMRAADPGAALAALMRRPLVKVCGLTSSEDVDAAAEAGADLAGFVLAHGPRRMEEPLPVPDRMLSVGIFVGAVRNVGTDLVQRYAEEGGHRGRTAELIRDGAPVARILDLPWEGHDDGHWGRAARLASQERVVLAGRLGPENVGRAVREVRPWCVDAARGLESAPGVKDHARVRAFVQEVDRACA